MQPGPANRIGIDYRAVPPRRAAGPIIDIHSHVSHLPQADRMFEAAAAYGITHIVSMSALRDVPALKDRWGERISFIAIPDWRAFAAAPAFQAGWIRDLAAFREHGARLCKFWVAPPLKAEHGLTLDHEFMRTVVWEAYELGYDFMVHVGDPSVWWLPGARYADSPRIGTKEQQYGQLEWLLESVAPRSVIAAHMGGFCEDPAFLERLLRKYENLHLDTSATKWIVREVARRPDEVRGLIERWPGRFLFGSDLVVARDYDTFDHYASRYWAHQMMWESGYRGQSPIDDPDADDPPCLAGLSLSDAALRAMYHETARKLELVG